MSDDYRNHLEFNNKSFRMELSELDCGVQLKLIRKNDSGERVVHVMVSHDSKSELADALDLAAITLRVWAKRDGETDGD